MKLITTTLLFVFLFVGVASAQHFNLGVKAGLNGYTTSNESLSDIDPKFGLHVGLIGHIHLADPFALQPELIFSMQGSKYSAAGTDVVLNLNYINIPLIFQYMYNNGFRLEAGPQIGVLASAKTKIGSTVVNVKDDFEPIDFGIGVGVSYVNPATDFGFDIRYNHGLSKINKGGASNTYNRGIQLGVFYLINHN